MLLKSPLSSNVLISHIPIASRENCPLLALVHWFTKFKSSPEHDTNLYVVKKDIDHSGQHHSGVVCLEDIKFPCPLSPVIKGSCDRNLKQENVLKECDSFYFNKYASHSLYQEFSQ